ncbi:hypothetical protein SDC9_07867 [bioreactor metagenome]|uniref:Uncharacterized protein n=1 Tax=bioreactor metagenome TaxID=1076179 RepID=A0A644T5N9_9ZZZZ|nr:hypothetical protein [Candidatus Elulimicrobiales bacterium]
MAKRKKRKLKKKFKFLLWLVILLLILGGVFYLNYKKIINVNTIWTETNMRIINLKSFFMKKEEKKVKTRSIDENEFLNNDNSKEKENDFVKIFRTRLPSKNLNFASSSEISANGDMKIFLQETKDSLGYLHVNTKNDPEYVWITFVSAIDAEPLKTELEKKIKRLEYIDLRFSNKVFYKFFDSETKIPEEGLRDVSTSTIIMENSTTSSHIPIDIIATTTLPTTLPVN